MIILDKITNFELHDLVEIAYRGDSDLLDYFWGEDFSLEEAVNETMGMVKIVSQEVPMDYYSVILDEQEIGYVCCFTHNLYSFGINIEFRTKSILSEFWEKIKEVMGESFICMLFPQNTRAINWLKKQGMVIVEGVEQNCVTLLNI